MSLRFRLGKYNIDIRRCELFVQQLHVFTQFGKLRAVHNWRFLGLPSKCTEVPKYVFEGSLRHYEHYKHHSWVGSHLELGAEPEGVFRYSFHPTSMPLRITSTCTRACYVSFRVLSLGARPSTPPRLQSPGFSQSQYPMFPSFQVRACGDNK